MPLHWWSKAQTYSAVQQPIVRCGCFADRLAAGVSYLTPNNRSSWIAQCSDQRRRGESKTSLSPLIGALRAQRNIRTSLMARSIEKQTSNICLLRDQRRRVAHAGL